MRCPSPRRRQGWPPAPDAECPEGRAGAEDETGGQLTDADPGPSRACCWLGAACLMPSFHCAPCWGRVTWRKRGLGAERRPTISQGLAGRRLSSRQRYFLSCGPCSSLHALCLRPDFPNPSTPHHTIHSHNQRLNTAISRCEAARPSTVATGPRWLWKLITTRHN